MIVNKKVFVKFSPNMLMKEILNLFYKHEHESKI